MEQNNMEKYINQKIYIPKEAYNENYKYYFNGNYIDVITNQNCYTQYNSTYCDCKKYEYKENILSESYSCNSSGNNARIGFEKITTEIQNNKSERTLYNQETQIYLIMIILGIVLAHFLTKERSSY